jgi:phage shock protein C
MNTENRKLYRSRDDRKIAGVCGGLAKHLNINVHLLRWAFVLTGHVTGALYLLMWIYLEEEPVDQPSLP